LICFPCLNFSIVISFPPTQHPTKWSRKKLNFSKIASWSRRLDFDMFGYSRVKLVLTPQYSNLKLKFKALGSRIEF
jgi:hypothetical protein